jgi:ribonuclease M5
MESKTLLDNRYFYICEGTTDEDKLKKLGCLFVIKTGGKFIRKDILTFIQEVHQVREAVLVLDPDGPGRDITSQIQKVITTNLVIKANKALAIKNNKVGIAEMNINDLKDLLWPYLKHDLYVDENPSIDDEDFYDLGLEGPSAKKLRMKLVSKYHLPFTSAKNVLEAVLMLGLTKKDIEETIANE